MSENEFVVDQEEWKTAGLCNEGSYKFEFLSMEPATRTRKDGNTYPVIAGRLVAVEKAEYDGEGNFVSTTELDRPLSRFQDFGIKGSSLQMLKSAYKTMTGRLPDGVLNPETGRYELDVAAVAKELVGHKAWNFVYWTDPDKNETGDIYDRLTYTFTSQPRTKVKPRKAEK